jgi:hypothetical protein
MTATFLRADDPRAPLQKATRYELIAYARANKLEQPIVATYGRQIDNIPADLLRVELKQRGLTRPPMRPRTLGLPTGEVMPEGPITSGPEVDAVADLKRQFLAQPAAPAAPPRPASVQSSPVPAPTAAVPQGWTTPDKPIAHWGINDLRWECRRLGIKVDRRDNKITMRQKIEGHGKDAAQRGQ